MKYSTQPDDNTISSNCTCNEVLHIDKDGFVYKGERIDDTGEAYKAFMEVMDLMRNNNERS